MKETFTPYAPERDPDFDREEAKAWTQPIAGEHTNFLVVEEQNTHQTEHDPNAATELQHKYLELEQRDGWLGVADTMQHNLTVLSDVAKGVFEEPGPRSSRLELITRSMWEDETLNKGQSMSTVYSGPNLMHLQAVDTSELAEQTTSMLDDLYDLTGAKVVRDDRKDPSQKTYRRYLLGEYQGKQLIFLEQSIIPEPTESNPERIFTVDLTDDMTVLNKLSLDEVEELMPHTGTSAYRMDKTQLPDAREMIKSTQDSISRL